MNRFYAVIGRVSIAVLAFFIVAILIERMADYLSIKLLNRMAAQESVTVAVRSLVAIARFVDRFYGLLFLPVVALAIILGIRQTRALE